VRQVCVFFTFVDSNDASSSVVLQSNLTCTAMAGACSSLFRLDRLVLHGTGRGSERIDIPRTLQASTFPTGWDWPEHVCIVQVM